MPDGTPGPDLPSLTSAMDLFAAPSTEEAFGLAAVEALAAGLPVLYGSCPAIEDLPPESPGRRAAGARWPGDVRPRDRRGARGGPGPAHGRRGRPPLQHHPQLGPPHGRVRGRRGGSSPSLHVKEAPSS